MRFSEMTRRLQSALALSVPQIKAMLRQNPAMAYSKITQLGQEVGRHYGMRLLVNFPQEGKIEEFEMYGRRDLSIIVDQTKTRFPIDRQVIKSRAESAFAGARIEDAYMYEGKEGVKIFFEGGRIDILPHSLHVWCEIDDVVAGFCDWLFENVY